MNVGTHLHYHSLKNIIARQFEKKHVQKYRSKISVKSQYQGENFQIKW